MKTLYVAIINNMENIMKTGSYIKKLLVLISRKQILNKEKILVDTVLERSI